ncbi:MAG: LamG-like jellyroll fold domain-containing protein [Erythrobacter sp.]
MFNRFLAIALLGFTLAAVPATAQQQGPQQAQEYAPIMMNFVGDNALMLPTTSALELKGSGTIEFWVSAKWTRPLGYDPAIMAYLGPLGTRFAFHIGDDRSGLGVYAGDFYDGVAFDFSDGLRHHVVIMTAGDTIDIFIDGELRGTLGFTFATMPVDRFTIGSLGDYSPFVGELGQIRIWDEPIEPEVLQYFALQPLNGQYEHPDLDALVGMSAFANPELSGFVFVGEPDEPNVTMEPSETDLLLPPPEPLQ